MRSRLLAVLLVTSLFFTSCWDVTDYESIKFEPVNVSYGFPVINSEISLMDLLDASGSDTTFFIEVRNDSILIRAIESLSYGISLVIPDNLFNQSIPVLPNSSDLYFDSYTTIENDSEIKSVDFSGGELWVEFEKNFAEDLPVTLNLTSLKISETESYSVNADWTQNPNLSRQTFPLTDTHLDLFRLEGLDTIYNNISYQVNLGETTGAGTLDVRIGFTQLEYTKITGNIQYFEDFGTEEIEVDFFSAISSGEIQLTDPRFRFKLGTSIGAPLSLLFTEIRFEKDGTNPLYLQNTSTEGNPLLIGQPTYAPFATITDPYAKSEFELNKNNSNLDEILPYSPNLIFFTGGYELGEIDPATQIDYIHDFFIYDTSSVNIDLDMEIPLTGRISDLVFTQEVADVSFPKVEEIDDFTIDDYNVAMFFKTINGIPLTFAMQVVFKDDLGASLDTLFSDNVSGENIIQSPPIDTNGDPVGTSELITRISLPMDKYIKISDATQAEIILTINSGDEVEDEVNIKASQILNVAISVAFDAKVTPDIIL